MPSIPDWIPNLHPLVVHFPISLVLVAVAADVGNVARPGDANWRDASTWLYCAGMLTTAAAYFTGVSAATTMPVPQNAQAAVTGHFSWADWATWFLVSLTALRLAMSYIWQTSRRRIVVPSSPSCSPGATNDLAMRFGVSLHVVARSSWCTIGCGISRISRRPFVVLRRMRPWSSVMVR